MKWESTDKEIKMAETLCLEFFKRHANFERQVNAKWLRINLLHCYLPYLFPTL